MATRKRQSVHQRISSDRELWEDEVLHEAYATRDEYAAEHGYDLDRIYADLKQREANSLLHRSSDEHLVQE